MATNMGFDRAQRLDSEWHRVPERARPEADLAPAVPGRRTLVEQLTEQRFADERARAAPPGRQTLVAHEPAADVLDFESYRVLALRDVLGGLRRTPELHEATIAAADREVARRATPALAARRPTTPTPDANGHAMWCAAERHAATLYRRAHDAGDASPADPVVEAALARAGSGAPLPATVQRAMEAIFGVSLGRVRVHTDAVAAAAARALRADAFTVGEDIFFAEGAFFPEARAGQRLLVHELTHVVQGWQGRTGQRAASRRVSQPGDALEQEAEATAERVDRGEPVGAAVVAAPADARDEPATTTSPSAAPIQRRISATPEFMQAAERAGALQVLLHSVTGLVQSFLLQVTDLDSFNIAIDTTDELPDDKFAATAIGWLDDQHELHDLEVGVTTVEEIWHARSIDVVLAMNTNNAAISDPAEVMENLAHELTAHVLPVAHLITAREVAGSLPEFANAVGASNLLGEWGPLDEDKQHDQLGKGLNLDFHQLINDMAAWLVAHQQADLATRLRRAAAVDVARHRIEVLLMRSDDQALVHEVYDQDPDLHAVADAVMTDHPEYVDVILDDLPGNDPG
jgi:hypothetical protein